VNTTDHQYVLELLDMAGAPLTEVRVTTDWEPARQCVRLAALRQHKVLPDEVTTTAIQPLWHSTVGQPYVSGFRVSLNADGRLALWVDFPITYWKEAAQQASAPMVEEGRLRSGEDFLYQVAAYPFEADRSERRAHLFTVEEAQAPLPCQEGRLAEHLRRSVPVGLATSHDMPVLIGPEVLEETDLLKEAAGSRESGGILIGHLYRDGTVPELFAEVTAQIPARYAPAEEMRLTFTPETWTDVQAAIELRAGGEMRLGWWHSHPRRHWSKSDGPACAASKGTAEFFSADDRLLHRAVFPAAYSIGLVVADTHLGGELWTTSWAAYGWRFGSIERRGFYLAGVRGVALTQEMHRYTGGEI
jgi:hypothetical protein